MIPEIDDALRRLVSGALPPGTQVRLDPPQPSWRAEVAEPAVDLFLFDLRRAGDRGCELSYLVTARANRSVEEHHLLDGALAAISATARMPPEYLAEGGLRDADVRVALAASGAGALWNSLGIPARAAFITTVTLPA